MQYNISRISKLIDKGFDINLVSFEYDIPIQAIIDYRRMIQEDNVRTKRTLTGKESKMQIMKRKYYSLLGKKEESKQVITENPLSKTENEQINLAIEKIENSINDMKSADKKEKRRLVFLALEEIKKIKDYNLTLSQAEQILRLLNSNELNTIPILNSQDKIYYLIRSARLKIGQRYLLCIEASQKSMSNLEELEALEKKLMSDKLQKSLNKFTVSALRSQIASKIERLKSEKAINDIRNNIPESIHLIISSLAEGSIDIKEAKKVIEEEAKRKMESKPKTKFSLSLEQEVGQISYQIRKVFVEKADKYKIEDTDLFLTQIMELCDIDDENAFSILVRNLINRKEYEKAREVCGKIPLKDEKGNVRMYLRNLKKEIVIAELGEIVFKGLNLRRTLEEENEYFNLIKEGLRKANITPKAVALPKSGDMSKAITLADIWPEDEQIIIK